MGKILKYLFYTYVILLAGHVSYGQLMSRQFTKVKVAFDPPEKKCYKGGKDWRYCVHLTGVTDVKAFLYVFHGRGQDENFWAKGEAYAGLLQQNWQQRSKKIPTVITVSFGDTWLVTPTMSKVTTGLMERFRREVFPIIENQLGAPSQRMLLGNSMGGLNALTVSLEMNEHFTRVAALCPPLFTMSPYDRWHKVLDFIRRTGAQPKKTFTIIGLGRHFFANTEEWLRFNPIEKVKNVAFKRSQAFYITAGTRDEFGIYEGVQEFVKNLRAKRAVTYWRPTSGDHCAVDIPSLANFLAL